MVKFLSLPRVKLALICAVLTLVLAVAFTLVNGQSVSAHPPSPYAWIHTHWCVAASDTGPVYCLQHIHSSWRHIPHPIDGPTGTA